MNMFYPSMLKNAKEIHITRTPTFSIKNGRKNGTTMLTIEQDENIVLNILSSIFKYS